MLKKIAKKLLRWFGILLGFLFVAFIVLYLVYNEPLPEGKMGAEADALAEKMQKAINQEAWDNTNFVQWSFFGAHQFIWDRKRHFVQVRWSSYKVLLDANRLTGKIYWKGQEQEYDPSIIETANAHFVNDAFWMNGFAQIHNGNPEHRLVDLEGSDQGLLVTYPTGGVTPGDSYLWILDENGLPKAWKMWVGIIPIGGLEVSWEDWTTLSSGAKVAQAHNIGPVNISVADVKAFQTLEEGGLKEDIFAVLETI